MFEAMAMKLVVQISRTVFVKYAKITEFE